MVTPPRPTRRRTTIITTQPPTYAGGDYAVWGRRVAAYIIDLAFLAPYYVLYWTVTTTHSDSSIGYMLFLFQAATFVFAVVNQIVLQGRTGASLGKMALRIKVLDEDTGRPIGMLRTFLRGLMHFLDTISIGVGYLWPLWDRRRQTFADKVMGTVVIHRATLAAQISAPFTAQSEA